MMTRDETPDDLNRLLEQLTPAAQGAARTTGEFPAEPHAQPIRIVDVHIYEPTEEEPPTNAQTIEGTPDPQEPQNQEPPRRKRRLIVLLACAGCIVLLPVLAVLVALPRLTPPVTVTIVPLSRQVSTTASMSINGRAPNTQSIPGRTLAAITMSQQKTVPTTGTTRYDAQAAHGTLLFYNAATVPQTILAGTLVSSITGVQVLTDQDAFLPAGTLATNGQAAVAAHAVQVGPEGNIHAGSIYGPCCRLNVFVTNTPFTGGREARTTQSVTPQDILSSAASLKTSLEQSMQAALYTQVRPDETLLLPLNCRAHVTPDQQPGAEAARLTLTVQETCMGTVYTTQAYHSAIQDAISHQAQTHLGDGYRMQGEPQATPIHIRTQPQGTIILEVRISATWQYQIPEDKQAQIKAQLAGKTKAQALSLLLGEPGIQTVSIEGETLPRDPARIRLAFLVTM